MSQSTTNVESSPPGAPLLCPPDGGFSLQSPNFLNDALLAGEEDSRQSRGTSAQRMDSELSVLFEHARPSGEAISELASNRSGYGVAWLLLEFKRKGRTDFPLQNLDLSSFSLSASKLKLLLTSIRKGPNVLLETLKCGAHVCRDPCLPVLLELFLPPQGEGPDGLPGVRSKTLSLSDCDLGPAAPSIFNVLPESLEHLGLSENRLRKAAMEGLGSLLSSGRLPALLSLDLSDNPLGPSGVRALAEGICSASRPFALKSLKLSRTRAKAEGVEALAQALKAKETTNGLQILDLEGNKMMAEGLKHLVSALSARSVPHLRVLILKGNSLSHVTPVERDYSPIRQLLCTSVLAELEELDLSSNVLFDIYAAATAPVVAGAAASLAFPGRFPKLRRLDLGGPFWSQMSAEQLLAFATALQVDGAPSLEELVIPRTGGNVGESPEGVVAFANAINAGRLSQLTSLTLQNRSDMTGESFAAFSRSLSTGKTPLLQTLDVEMHNGHAEKGVEAIAETIQGGELSLLRTFRLDLRGRLSIVTDSGAIWKLGASLGCGGCPALQTLELNWREEGDVGIGGLAQGLGEGGLPCLEDLSLDVKCWGEGEGSGFVDFGEVLSTGKVPSLRTLTIALGPCDSVPFLCEGLSRGRMGPRVQVDLGLSGDGNIDEAVTRLADLIREGKFSSLQKIAFKGFYMLSESGGEMLGEALTHADACMNSLEEIFIEKQSSESVVSLLKGLCRGAGRLPALESLRCPPIDSQGAECLHALVNGAKIPALRDLKWVGMGGVESLTAALNSPNISALRELEVGLCLTACGGSFPGGAVAAVKVFSTALSSGNLRRLEELCVRTVRAPEATLALCEGLNSGKMSSLRKLQLHEVSLETEGAKALSEVVLAEKLPCLRTLVATSTRLTDAGFQALAEAWMSQPPPPLERLHIQYNNLTGGVTDILLKLLESDCLPALENVKLYSNYGMDEHARSLLSVAFPEVIDFGSW
uniref:Uncharacterized protein n=1 Tax=Chromera velia CCMP2878 TaxID=1169474 RepID=A0A0G4GAV6_9ALVE|eukprot:Cvel_21068.t1-p1 / transcript=Cvel_21068.t1 / gene=Cvel_21068 / organism=Chromera_velia_CCMP2878 / gene_product=hypothetical protein / transcript_product=hypothetical protein / location=Cvel_scaffold1947:13878-18894(+) / protein_length=984 / sequence_SO=supercontig / SO=protein_coding / is_pseudo=false